MNLDLLPKIVLGSLLFIESNSPYFIVQSENTDKCIFSKVISYKLHEKNETSEHDHKESNSVIIKNNGIEITGHTSNNTYTQIF